MENSTNNIKIGNTSNSITYSSAVNSTVTIHPYTLISTNYTGNLSLNGSITLTK